MTKPKDKTAQDIAAKHFSQIMEEVALYGAPIKLLAEINGLKDRLTALETKSFAEDPACHTIFDRLDALEAKIDELGRGNAQSPSNDCRCKSDLIPQSSQSAPDITPFIKGKTRFTDQEPIDVVDEKVIDAMNDKPQQSAAPKPYLSAVIDLDKETGGLRVTHTDHTAGEVAVEQSAPTRQDRIGALIEKQQQREQDLSAAIRTMKQSYDYAVYNNASKFEVKSYEAAIKILESAQKKDL